MKRYFNGLDVLKYFAAVGVIAIHSNLPLFKIIGRLGVPFFVITSSFLFFRKEKSKIIFSRIKKFEFRIAMLFISWELFYVPLAIFHIIKWIDKFKGNFIIKIIDCLFYFFYPVPYTLNGWGPSWYLIGMFVGVPVFVLLLKLSKNNLIIVGLICLILEIYYILANEFNFITHFNNFGTYSFPRLLIYIFSGYLIAKYYQKLDAISFKYLICFFILFLSIFLLENFLIYLNGGSINSEEVISLLPTSFVLVLFGLRWNPNLDKYKNSFLRNSSTFLYCFQAWPFFFINKLVVQESFVIEFCVFIFVLGSCQLAFLIFNNIKIKTEWKLFSYMV